MTHKQFGILLEELDGTGSKVLSEKNARYSTSDDALQNFHEGAEIMGCTTAQACWGYMTKHLSALRKMIWSNDFSNRADVYEKCIDTINYIRFLWAISEEERNKLTENDSCIKYPDWTETERANCCDCKFHNFDIKEHPCLGCKNNYGPETKQYKNFPLKFQPKT